MITRWLHSARGRRRDERGAISIMAAVMMLAVLAATALAVDVGRVAYTSRDQQFATDRAALDAVRVLGDQLPPGAVDLGDLHSAVEQRVLESLARNRGAADATSGPREVTLVELGVVAADGTFDVACSAALDASFEPSCPQPVGTASAVRVGTESVVDYIFAIGGGQTERTVVKESVAHQLAIAKITVGSELLAVNNPLVNSLFSQMLCPPTNPGDPPTCALAISAAGYNGLLTTQVRLGDLLEPLGIVAGAPDEVLAAEVGVAELLDLGLTALDDQASPAAIALNQLTQDIDTSLTIPLGELGHVTTSDVGQAADAQINLFELVRTAAQVSNGTNFLSVPDLGVTIPGLADVTADVSIIEAPRWAVGPAARSVDDPTQWQTVARTAQARVNLEATLSTDLVGALGSVLRALSLGTLSVTADDVVVPIGIEVARGEAALTGIACGPGSDPQQLTTFTTTQTTTRVGSVVIDDGAGGHAQLAGVRIRVRAPLFGTTIADVRFAIRARADSPLGGVNSAEHTFSGPYRDGPERTSGSSLGLSGLGSNLDIDVDLQAGGVTGVLSPLLGVIESTLESTVTSGLTSVLAPLEASVIDPVLAATGVQVGNADTWVDSVDCQHRQLAPLP